MPRIYKIFCSLLSIWHILIFSGDAGAQNLVRNGSFEEYSTEYCDRISSDVGQIDSLPALYWYSVDNGEPEYYREDTVLVNCRVEADLWFFKPELFKAKNSIEGKAWMGLCLFVWDGYSERITGELSSSLLKDSTYLISFYVKISEISLFGIHTIGIQFSRNPTSLNGMIDPYYSIPKFQINKPNIEFDISETCSTKNWVKISGSYKAKGGERSLTIGYYYPEGFNWSSAFDKYNTWTLYDIRNAYQASRKLVRRAPDLGFSSVYVEEISEYEISYYFIDNIEISLSID